MKWKMKATLPSRGVAAIGVLFVALSEFYTFRNWSNLLAAVGVVILAVVSVNVAVRSRRGGLLVDAPATSVLTWPRAYVVSAILGALVVQTWFRWGHLLAGFDYNPSLGTAWVTRIFNSYGWNGNDLGGSVMNQSRLPWGAFELAVHLLGGSTSLAQQLWLTVVVVGVVLSTVWFSRAIHLSPLAAVVASFFYLTNPYTQTSVNFSDVYLSAMGLIPFCSALVLLYVRGQMATWKLVTGFILAAPFFGYAYLNPPLVGMVGGAIIVILILAGLSEGWKRFGRKLAGLTAAFGALMVASLYWIIPAMNSLSLVSTKNLSGVSTWTWTESRATLANAMWLNTSWAWNISIYNPAAPSYVRFPLEWVPILLPVVVFGVFLLAPGRLTSNQWKTVSVASLASLGIVILSTGTRFPMGPVFNVLYGLPYGWLIREPGRFLMVAALGFAIMSGVALDGSYAALMDRLRSSSTASSRNLGRVRNSRNPVITRLLALGLVGGVIVAMGYPVWTGIFIPGARQGFPSERVSIPSYWTSMVDYLNSAAAPSGALLALPADDFYQMPYRWYYGADGFLVDALSRHVVVPSTQGYTGAGANLVDATNTVDGALISHQWSFASAVLEALGTPLILVRGDIIYNLPGRHITNPALLANALRHDPQMRGVMQKGPLTLFALRTGLKQRWSQIATTPSTSPSLDLLRVMKPSQMVISSDSIPGVMSIVPLPPASQWKYSGGKVSTSLRLPPGARLQVVDVRGNNLSAMSAHVASRSTTSEEVQIINQLTPHGLNLSAASPPKSCVTPRTGIVLNTLLRSSGGWSSGSQFWRVIAGKRVACTAINIPTVPPTMYVAYDSKVVSGVVAGVCLLELPSGSCATVTWSIHSEPGGWVSRSGSFIPLVGTTSLQFVAEAGSVTSNAISETDYRNAVVVPAGLTMAFVEATPRGAIHKWTIERLSPNVPAPAYGSKNADGTVVSLAGLAPAILK